MFFRAVRTVLAWLSLGLVISCSAGPDASVWEDYAKAKIVYAQGRIPEAVESLRTLVARAGNFPPARLLYGRALYFHREYAKAHDVLLALTHDHPESVEGALWLIRTDLEQKKAADAEALLVKLLAVNPDDPRLAYQMALIRENRNDLAGAKDFLASAETSDEDMALIHYEAARVGYQLHDVGKANAEITQALAFLPGTSLLRKPLERLQKDLASSPHKE